jgi:hypothetical protein
MKQFLVIAAMTVWVFCACNKTPADNTSFNENIKITMTELVDSASRTLVLNCITEKVYPCFNFTIQSTYSVTSDKITVNFTKVNESSICLAAIGPAHTTITLGALSNKNYQLEIHVGNTIITGQLDVTATNYKVALPVQNKVQFINPNLGRVPYNTIYGTVHYPVASAALLVQKYIDSLQFFGATATVYPQGDYGAFQIEANGQIKQVQDPGYYFTRYFIFNYNNNSLPLKNLGRRFGISYPDSLQITLHTTKGETFNSWVP